jgi:protein-L-isoaspartate(D-aspartate) O-methyltransferase
VSIVRGEEFARERRLMVRTQLEPRGIRDARVLAAMRAVPRELFVPPEVRELAYADQPLPIGEGQTISQPYVVARMAELAELRSTDVVLDVGCGSGYQTAVLARLAAHVYGVEIRPELAAQATSALAALGVANATVVAGDGGYGLPEHAPYQAILVAAAAAQPPPALLDQLDEGGRLILPEGGREMQCLVRLVRTGTRLEREEFGAVRFVAFVGDYGES